VGMWCPANYPVILRMALKIIKAEHQRLLKFRSSVSGRHRVSSDMEGNIPKSESLPLPLNPAPAPPTEFVSSSPSSPSPPSPFPPSASCLPELAYSLLFGQVICPLLSSDSIERPHRRFFSLICQILRDACVLLIFYGSSPPEEVDSSFPPSISVDSPAVKESLKKFSEYLRAFLHKMCDSPFSSDLEGKGSDSDCQAALSRVRRSLALCQPSLDDDLPDTSELYSRSHCPRSLFHYLPLSSGIYCSPL
jgi:hypothetical protein